VPERTKDMTKTALKQIIRRAINDRAFRAELQRDPAKALVGMGLAPAELAALASADPRRLTELGVDQRMSKAFMAGGISSVSRSIDPGITSAYSSGRTFIDEGGYDGRVIPGDPTLERPAAVQPGQSANALHMRLVEQDLNVAHGAVLAAALPPSTSTGAMSADGTSFDAGLISGIGEALGEAANAAADAVADMTNMRRIEQDLDVTQGTNLDLPRPGADPSITEY